MRNDAVTMRTRLCIVPVVHSSRMPASTSGTPVRPSSHARSAVGCRRGHGNASNSARQFRVARSGAWNSTCQANSRHPSSVQEAVGALAARPPLAQRVPHLVRAELAPAQVRRQARRHRRWAGRRVPSRTSARSSSRNVARVARARRRRPGVHASRRPPAQSGRVGSSSQSSRSSLAASVGRLDRVGCGQRMPRLGRRAARAPERREHRERRALARCGSSTARTAGSPRSCCTIEPVVVQRLLQSRRRGRARGRRIDGSRTRRRRRSRRRASG